MERPGQFVAMYNILYSTTPIAHNTHTHTHKCARHYFCPFYPLASRCCHLTTSALMACEQFKRMHSSSNCLRSKVYLIYIFSIQYFIVKIIHYTVRLCMRNVLNTQNIPSGRYDVVATYNKLAKSSLSLCQRGHGHRANIFVNLLTTTYESAAHVDILYCTTTVTSSLLVVLYNV